MAENQLSWTGLDERAPEERRTLPVHFGRVKTGGPPRRRKRFRTQFQPNGEHDGERTDDHGDDRPVRSSREIDAASDTLVVFSA